MPNNTSDEQPQATPAPVVGPTTPPPIESNESNPQTTIQSPTQSEMIEISKDQWEETQRMLKLLYEAADKGRIYNLENQGAQKKPLQVKVSLYRESVIIGWRTIKDKAVFHPTTGKQVGE